MTKMEKSLENRIMGDVNIEQDAIQETADSIMETVKTSLKLQKRLIRCVEAELDANPTENADQAINFRQKLARADTDNVRNLDMLFRLNEFAQGNADSRNEMNLNSRELLKNLPDHLLRALMEHVKEQEATKTEKPEGLLQ